MSQLQLRVSRYTVQVSSGAAARVSSRVLRGLRGALRGSAGFSEGSDPGPIPVTVGKNFHRTNLILGLVITDGATAGSLALRSQCMSSWSERLENHHLGIVDRSYRRSQLRDRAITLHQDPNPGPRISLSLSIPQKLVLRPLRTRREVRGIRKGGGAKRYGVIFWGENVP